MLEPLFIGSQKTGVRLLVACIGSSSVDIEDIAGRQVFHDSQCAHVGETWAAALFQRLTLAQKTLHFVSELRFVLHDCRRYICSIAYFCSLS